MKKVTGVTFLLFLAKIAEKQQKMLIFWKNHEISNFPKNRNICPKCIKSKFDRSNEVFLAFCIAQLRIRAIRRWNFEAYGDLVGGK